MHSEIQEFITYMRDVRHAADNTVVSYERDLQKLRKYLESQGVFSADKVTSVMLNTYVLHLENMGMSTATVSRTVAAIRRFFTYQCSEGVCGQNPSETLKAPKVVKKMTHAFGREEMKLLLELEVEGPKQLRDRAMLLCMCQGVRASEVIALTLEDLRLDLGYLTVQSEKQTRTVPLGDETCEALKMYLNDGRELLLRGKTTDTLFVNCTGGKLSRQGVWKVVKQYGQQIGIPDLTPDSLRMPLSVQA